MWFGLFVCTWLYSNHQAGDWYISEAGKFIFSGLVWCYFVAWLFVLQFCPDFWFFFVPWFWAPDSFWSCGFGLLVSCGRGGSSAVFSFVQLVLRLLLVLFGGRGILVILVFSARVAAAGLFFSFVFVLPVCCCPVMVLVVEVLFWCWLGRGAF
ncbi:hypothetical protein LXL04_015755 [Taraxacum kok-saghyz]